MVARRHCIGNALFDAARYGRNYLGSLSAIMQDIYGQIVAISTIVAVTVGAIALIIRMVSRNQRAVDEATQWLKRIVITWIILNSLGFIVAYLQPLIAGGNYSPGGSGGGGTVTI